MDSTFIYFIAGGGKTKIGIAAKPEMRLRTIQANSPVPLRLLGSMRGSWYGESILHRHFNDRHSHGEWFNGEFSNKDIQEAVKVIQDHSRQGTKPRKTNKTRPHRNVYKNNWTPEQWLEHDKLWERTDRLGNAELKRAIREENTTILLSMCSDENSELNKLISDWIAWLENTHN